MARIKDQLIKQQEGDKGKGGGRDSSIASVGSSSKGRKPDRFKGVSPDVKEEIIEGEGTLKDLIDEFNKQLKEFKDWVSPHGEKDASGLTFTGEGEDLDLEGKNILNLDEDISARAKATKDSGGSTTQRAEITPDEEGMEFAKKEQDYAEVGNWVDNNANQNFFNLTEEEQEKIKDKLGDFYLTTLGLNSKDALYSLVERVKALENNDLRPFIQDLKERFTNSKLESSKNLALEAYGRELSKADEQKIKDVYEKQFEEKGYDNQAKRLSGVAESYLGEGKEVKTDIPKELTKSDDKSTDLKKIEDDMRDLASDGASSRLKHLREMGVNPDKLRFDVDTKEGTVDVDRFTSEAEKIFDKGSNYFSKAIDQKTDLNQLASAAGEISKGKGAELKDKVADVQQWATRTTFNKAKQMALSNIHGKSAAQTEHMRRFAAGHTRFNELEPKGARFGKTSQAKMSPKYYSEEGKKQLAEYRKARSEAKQAKETKRITTQTKSSKPTKTTKSSGGKKSPKTKTAKTAKSTKAKTTKASKGTKKSKTAKSLK